MTARVQYVGLLSDDDEAKDIIDILLDSSGSAASSLRPGFAIDKSIDRSARRVERKPRLDEFDEQQ